MTNKLVGQSEHAIRDSKQQETMTLRLASRLFCKGSGGKGGWGEFLKKLWCCVGGEVVYKNLVLSTELIM